MCYPTGLEQMKSTKFTVQLFYMNQNWYNDHRFSKLHVKRWGIFYKATCPPVEPNPPAPRDVSWRLCKMPIIACAAETIQSHVPPLLTRQGVRTAQE